MSEPVSQEQAQAAVAAQLQGQAAGVQGSDQAGIYGDPAGASQHSPVQSEAQVAADLHAKGAQAAQVDAEALLAQIQADAARIAELRAQAEAHAFAVTGGEPKPPVLGEVVAALSGVSPGIVHAFTVLSERLDAAGI